MSCPRGVFTEPTSEPQHPPYLAQPCRIEALGPGASWTFPFGSRNADWSCPEGPLHLVSAWASEQGLVLGQRAVDGKSNEITAIPALLDTLVLNNSIVTLDAMGCQKTIAGRILEQGAGFTHEGL